jgi:hypothetical protein
VTSNPNAQYKVSLLAYGSSVGMVDGSDDPGECLVPRLCHRSHVHQKLHPGVAQAWRKLAPVAVW